VVKLISMFRRKPELSPEEFHRYWREVHGPLVASTKTGQHALRYEQNHRPLEDYANAGTMGYDGVTEQWFASLDDFYASLREDDFPLVDEDMKKFIDTSTLVWIMTEDAEVIFG
jgi:uncharacterized protein (TIGR02118 family)